MTLVLERVELNSEVTQHYPDMDMDPHIGVFPQKNSSSDEETQLPDGTKAGEVSSTRPFVPPRRVQGGKIRHIDWKCGNEDSEESSCSEDDFTTPAYRHIKKKIVWRGYEEKSVGHVYPVIFDFQIP